MRAYLLGQLPEPEADALEAEYFADRAVFLQVQSVEKKLITEYLDGKLPALDRQSFESRYTQVPQLQQRLEEVKRVRADRRPASRLGVPPFWRPALAVALLMLIVAGVWFYQVRLKSTIQTSNQTSGTASHDPGKPVVPAMATVFISPGLVKGPSSKWVQFEQPAADASIFVILELPGQSVPVRTRVHITRMQPDGRKEPAWDANNLPSESVNGSQALRFQLAGSLLRPGDYALEVSTPDGALRETYVCRVTPRPTK